MCKQSEVFDLANGTLTLDKLLAAIRQLDEPARAQVAQALLEADFDAKLATLIRRLAARQPADDITDDDIDVEVKAVRQIKAASENA